MMRKKLDIELGKACEEGNLELAKQLFDAGGAFTFDEKGRHPLHLAAAEGCLPVVKWIVKLSISVNLPQNDRDGMSPLLLAARFGHVKLFNWLLGQRLIKSNYVSGENKEWNILSAAAAAPNLQILEIIMLNRYLPGIEFISKANARTRAAIIAQCRYFILLSENLKMIKTSIFWMGSILSNLCERLKEANMDTTADQIGLPADYLKLLKSACHRRPELYMECAQYFMEDIDKYPDPEERRNLTNNELMRILNLPFLRESAEYSAGVLLLLGWKFLQLSGFFLKDALSLVTKTQELGGALIDFFQGNTVVRYQAFWVLADMLSLSPPGTSPEIKPLPELIILHRRPLNPCLFRFSVRRDVSRSAPIKQDLDEEIKNAICLKDQLHSCLLSPVNEKARIKLFTTTAQALFPASRREELKDETFRQAIVTFNIAAEQHRNQVTKQIWQGIDTLDSVVKHDILPACG